MSSIKTRKQKEIESRMDYIVEIAEELFDKNGFENVSMDQISKASEFSKPTLYKYFISKDEIALFVYKNIQKRKIPFMEKYISDSGTGAEKLFQIAMGFRDFFIKYPESLKFQLEWDYKGLKKDKVRPEALEEVIVYFDSEMSYIKDLVKKGITDGSFSSNINHEVILNMFYLLLRAILNQQLFMKEWVYSPEVNHKDSFELFVNIYLKGLQPEK